MMRIGLASVALAAVLASSAGGCKDSVLGQNPGTGGSGGVGSCASDLSGVWDVMATRPGGGTFAWVMTINATTFSMSRAGSTLLYTDGATKQLTFTRSKNIVPVNVTNVPEALNSGSIPLALGGNWSFSSNGETCTVNVTVASAMASCQGPGGPGSYVGTSNWPYPLPSPMHGRNYGAMRVSQLPSQLGELGGEWHLTNGPGTCTATVEGNRITATCTNAQPLTGTLQLTLGNDCVASGTSGGLELSAHRR